MNYLLYLMRCYKYKINKQVKIIILRKPISKFMIFYYNLYCMLLYAIV